MMINNGKEKNSSFGSKRKTSHNFLTLSCYTTQNYILLLLSV